MIAHKLDVVYRDYRCDTINSETAIKNIIGLLDAFEYVSGVEHDKKYIAELVKKGIRYIIRIDANSKQAYKFLESCIIDDTLDINTRYEIYKTIESSFPNKVKGLRKYLLRNECGYFPDNIKFKGESIIEFGLTDFLFKNNRILSSYSDFAFNYNYKGLTNENCLIINEKHDIYKVQRYTARFLYAQRLNWKIEGIGSSYYLIDDNYKIGVRDLMFAVNLFKNYVQNFKDKKLKINFSKDIEMPIQMDYEGCDIKIYFFSNKL